MWTHAGMKRSELFCYFDKHFNVSCLIVIQVIEMKLIKKKKCWYLIIMRWEWSCTQQISMAQEVEGRSSYWKVTGSPPETVSRSPWAGHWAPNLLLMSSWAPCTSASSSWVCKLLYKCTIFTINKSSSSHEAKLIWEKINPSTTTLPLCNLLVKA